MSENQPIELRDRLSQQRAELTERIARIRANLGRGLDANSAEQATQLENEEVLHDLVDEAQEELVQIDAALQRVADGTYGLCSACGEQIDSRRLEANPSATECISCASNN